MTSRFSPLGTRRSGLGVPISTPGLVTLGLFINDVNFVISLPGIYIFHLYGAGESGGYTSTYALGGPGGGYARKTARLTARQMVSFVVGKPNPNQIGVGWGRQNTVLTLPGGFTATATGASGSSPGGGVNGDINLTGGASGGVGSVSAAPTSGGGIFGGVPGNNNAPQNGAGGGGGASGLSFLPGGTGGSIGNTTNMVPAFPGGGGMAIYGGSQAYFTGAQGAVVVQYLQQ
jgi:hypothetical protein